MLISLALFELIILGFLAAFFNDIKVMVFIQTLDGIGAGITGMILPVLVILILRGSGHINAGLAFVMTCGGIGGALSNGLGGLVAQYFGYFYAYAILALVAAFGLLVWIFALKFFKNF